jgi:hypothetical protein
MKQILHIFAKDVRRFWPEILTLLALVAAFIILHSYIWAAPMRYDQGASFGGTLAMLTTLFGFLVVLIPIGWWLLITLAIQEERLVGDTQFWITRPYQWKNLLTAKLLFALAFVYLPIFLAQCVLLAEEGFRLQPNIPGLLSNLLIITATVVLPLIALATVTSNFSRMTLTVLGALLVFGAGVTVSAVTNTNQMSSPGSSLISPVLEIVLCAAAVLLQFGLRKTWLSRTLLIAFPVLLCAIAFLAPDQWMINRTYPVAGATAPIQFTHSPSVLRPTESGSMTGSSNRNGNNWYRIRVPLELSGITEGNGIASDGVRATIDAPDGFHWSSKWQALSIKYLPGDKFGAADITVPSALYEKYKSTPVTVHLDLALTQIKAGRATTVPLSQQEANLPEVGICAWAKDVGMIKCRSAVRMPPLTLISTGQAGYRVTRTSTGQVDTSSQAYQVEPGSYWVGWFEAPAKEPHIVPIRDFGFTSYRGTDGVGGALRMLDPGTRVTFTQYSAVRRLQTSLTIQNFHFPAQPTLNELRDAQQAAQQ